ncbi:sugar nucleotide-binding protein [Candidatus Woesearchaeota archaeon]|nr:sugar nucleotide-binding protein [Candidatus Woesearchaeota archaeon]
MVNISVIGASGLVGSNVLRAASELNLPVEGSSLSQKSGLKQLDITDYSQLKNYIQNTKPETIVNCAGIVGKEACNKEPGMAVAVNKTAVEYLSRLCIENGIKLFHLSTVAVHDGKKQTPYVEEDLPTLIDGNWYNITKVGAENFALEVPSAVILRVGDTYGYGINPEHIGGSIFKWAYETLKKGNNVPAFKGLRTNQTLLSDVGNVVMHLISEGYEGILNIGGNTIEVAEFFEKMCMSFNLPGNIELKDVPSNYQANRELGLTKMNLLGIKMHDVQEGLESLIQYYRI